MRNFTLTIAMLLFSIMVFAQEPCPVSFKRNNGNGVCGGAGQLTLQYATCPSAPQTIDFVIIGTAVYPVTFAAPSSCSSSKHEVTYCVTSGNMPPANTWEIHFSNGSSTSVCLVSDPSGGPLPIQLSSFFAKRMGNEILLNWQTASEVNFKEFVIEQKIENDFIKIGTVTATNKATGSTYSFSYKNGAKQTSQYRLKLVNNDGSYKYSEIRVVKGSATTSDFTIFPNPSMGTSKITISDISEPIDVQLADNLGRVIKTISLNNSNSIELNNLQKGVYVVRIINKNTGDAVVKKLTVVN